MNRKESIKNTALKLIAEKVYNATSIRDICKVEGVKTSTIYTYFESKGQLFIEILKECESKYLDNITLLNFRMTKH